MTAQSRGRPPHPDILTPAEWAVFDAHGVRLYLHRKDDKDWRSSSVLYFTVDDIHAAQAALGTGGVKFAGAPHVVYTDNATGAEEWMSFFEDGEGNTLALMSRVSPA